MRIIFLNAWNGRVREEIAQFIGKQAANTGVFCLQESYDEMRDLCSSILQDFQLVKDYKYITDTDDFPQATYIRKNIDIVRSVPILQDIPNVGLGLYTELTFNDQVLHLCNVHGVSKPGDKLDTKERLIQSQGIIDFYRDLEGPKVIGGDFNLELNTESVLRFENQGYKNLIKDYGITNTRNRLVWERFPENKQYYSDYVFVSPDVDVVKFGIPEVEVSDHQPMILEVNI